MWWTLSHKISTSENFNRVILGSIRNKVLLKLLILYNYYFMKPRQQEIDAIMKRARKKNPNYLYNKINLAYALRPEDVMHIIHVSKRTAYEYIQALRIFIGH